MKLSSILTSLADSHDHNIKFASFDITNMWSNIPTNELVRIINQLWERNNLEDRLKHDIIKISQVIIDQNYFRFQDTIYIQN